MTQLFILFCFSQRRTQSPLSIISSAASAAVVGQPTGQPADQPARDDGAGGPPPAPGSRLPTPEHCAKPGAQPEPYGAKPWTELR